MTALLVLNESLYYINFLKIWSLISFLSTNTFEIVIRSVKKKYTSYCRQSRANTTGGQLVIGSNDLKLS